MKTINLAEKFAQIDAPWSPHIVAGLNDYHLKLAKFHGSFEWHSHADTDEAFLVLDGAIEIEFRDRTIQVAAGELAVVPAGVEHRPVASEPASVLMIEPAGTTNTGQADGDTGTFLT